MWRCTMLTLKHMRAAARQSLQYGQGRHVFGQGFKDPRAGMVSRDDTPSQEGDSSRDDKISQQKGE